MIGRENVNMEKPLGSWESVCYWARAITVKFVEINASSSEGDQQYTHDNDDYETSDTDQHSKERWIPIKLSSFIGRYFDVSRFLQSDNEGVSIYWNENPNNYYNQLKLANITRAKVTLSPQGSYP